MQKSKAVGGDWVWGRRAQNTTLALILPYCRAWGILDKVKGNCKIRPGNLPKEAQCKALGLRQAEKVEELWGKGDLAA